MSGLQISDQGNGYFVIEGDLTFATIDKRTITDLVFLSTAKAVTLDLSHVTNSDSAGLALIIECLKYARHYQTQLSFNNIPKQLLNLAKLSGLDDTSYFTYQPER